MPGRRDAVPASTEQLRDPFLGNQRNASTAAAATPQPAKTAASPSNKSGTFAADFDSQLAALGKKAPASTPATASPQTATPPAFKTPSAAVPEEDTRPVPDFMDRTGFTPRTDELANTDSSDPFANLQPVAKQTASADSNPFADFMSEATSPASAAAVPGGDGEPRPEPHNEEPSVAAFTSEAATVADDDVEAGEGAAQAFMADFGGNEKTPTPVAPAFEPTLKPSSADNAATGEDAARARVEKLMDAAELALKSSQLDKASDAITSAVAAANDADLAYAAEERNPFTLQRRIEAGRQAALAVAANSGEPHADGNEDAFADFEPPAIVAAPHSDSARVTASKESSKNKAVGDESVDDTSVWEPVATNHGKALKVTTVSHGKTHADTPVTATSSGVVENPFDTTSAVPGPPEDVESPFDGVADSPEASAGNDRKSEPSADADSAEPTFEQFDEELFTTFDASMAASKTSASPKGMQPKTASLEVAPPPPMMLEASTADLGRLPGETPLWPLLLTVAVGFVAVFTFRGKPEAAA